MVLLIFTWVAYGLAGINDTCTFSVHVVEYGSPGLSSKSGLRSVTSLVCHDQINISLDDSCERVITPVDVLAGLYGCVESFQITLNYPHGTQNLNPANQLDRSHLGYEIVYTLKDPSDGASCWGKIKVEDKAGPKIECKGDTITCF